MATNLRRMKIREISLVDAPASPGAEIILSKRAGSPSTYRDVMTGLEVAEVIAKAFDPSEPRDARGRWTRAAGAISNAARKVYGHAKNIASLTLGHAHHAVISTKLNSVRPVRGGGVQFHLTNTTRDRKKIDTFVQVRPEHVKDNVTLANGLKAAHEVLYAYNVPIAEPIPGRIYSGRITDPYGYTTATSNVNAPGARTFDGATNIRTATTSPVAAAQAQPTTREQLRAQQGQPHPDNGLPINVIPGQKDENGIVIPLNHPSIDYSNSNGHSYLNEDGTFIPSGPTDHQKYIDQTNQNAPRFASLPQATPETSGGNAYKTENQDVIPAGQMYQQQRFEQRYSEWNSKIESEAMRQSASAPTVPTRTVSVPSMEDFAGVRVTRLPPAVAEGGESQSLYPETRTHRTYLDKRLFDDEPWLFDVYVPQLFNKETPLFKAYDASEARNALGRWTSGAAGVASAAAARLRQPGTKSAAAAKIAGKVTGMAVGAVAPTEVSDHAELAVAHLVHMIALKVQNDPRYSQLAQKLLRAGRLLFRKSQKGSLGSDDCATLKSIIASVMSKTSLPSKIAGDEEMKSAVCQKVFDHLHDQLSAR